MIHCCDTCLKPILIYGRMIPCKHVFCLNCATTHASKCKRCGDKVTRIEPVGLGSIYMCSHGGSRYEHTGCRRTYLSQRDLQAHIQHRHVKGSAAVVMQQQLPAQAAVSTAATTVAPVDHRKARDDGRTTSSVAGYHEPSNQDVYRTQRSAGYPHVGAHGQQPPQTLPGYVQPSSASQQHISVIGAGASRQSNLITVPIHDNSNGVSIPDTQRPPPGVVPGYPPYSSSASYSQQLPASQQQQQQHFYPQAPPASSYSESSQISQYSSQSSQQWRTGGSSSYYRR